MPITSDGMSLLMRTCALAGVLTSIALALAAPPSAHAVQVGTVPDITWGTSRATIDRTIGLLRQSGVQWMRASVPWNAIEPDRPGSYNQAYLSDIDYAIARAREAGIEVIVPVQDGVPYWASADPAKYTDAHGVRHYAKSYHPTDYGDFARFFAFIVRRYKGLGVHAYEVWNEPNLKRFWPSGPDPRQYTEMLEAAYPAIKAADPASTVILGGLAGSDRGYMASLYAHGARGLFDAAAVHAYSYGDPTNCWTDSAGHNARDAFCGLEEIREVMVANGDADKRIWITEMGWSTCRNAAPACYRSGVTPAEQADYLTKAFRLLDERYPYVPVAVVYNFRNNEWQHDDPDDWEAQTGLMNTRFAPKPAYFALAAYAKANRRGAAPAGPTPTAPPRAPDTPTRPSNEPTTAHVGGPSAARGLRLRVHRGSARRTRVTGRVRPAERGRVRLEFVRWSRTRDRWRKVAVRHARVRRGGRFRLSARTALRGRWRVHARFMGGDAPVAYRAFRITA